MKKNPAIRPLLLGLAAVVMALAPLSASIDSPDAAVIDAHRIAANGAHSLVVHVTGTSMRPFFDHGAVLVARATELDSIKAGMVVVYHNRFGEVVVHRAERLTAEGWVMRGYNNTEIDSTLLTSENLVGTVYATFNPTGRPASVVRLAGLDRRGELLALAAPAR